MFRPVLFVLATMAASPALAFEPASYYATTCAACHGATGAGDGPAGAALPVKAADFTDPAFWSSRDDATVKKAIKEGGAAIGKSPMMAAFGATMPDADLDALVTYLHTFEKKEAKAPPPAPVVEPVTPEPATKAAAPAPKEDASAVADADDDLEGDPEPSPEDKPPDAAPVVAPEPTPEPVEEPAGVVATAIRLPTPEADLAHGERLYGTRCAVCHGRDGAGDGPAARFMDPAPGDFTAGVYKFTSTPMGQPAAHEDLFRVITDGMPGTAMPGWRGLSSEDRWQLVFYLESLSPRFAEGDGTPFVIPAPPASTPDLVATGARLYAEAGCTACHGPDGRGDGVGAEGMVDAKRKPLRPADMTRGSLFRGGSEPVDIYRTLTAGIEGTPMPSFGHLSEADRWAVVHWIRGQFADADATLQ